MHYMHISALVVAYITTTIAISLDVNNTESIKNAAKIVAGRMTSYYIGHEQGGSPGVLPDPYYWWEAGGMFGSLIDYWHFTGDSQYNTITSEAMLHQASDGYNYMPPNQTKDEGNDDQAFWAFTVMSAAEYAFPEPPSGNPSWIAMAQAVWNTQVTRWDTLTCGGGLRWQILTLNPGYTYKNTPSNAGFMNLGARLYAYTGNETYRDYAIQSWDWMESIGLISPDYLVFDGSDANLNCTELDHTRWSYNAGLVLHTAAVMWNETEDATWKHRVDGVWNASAAAFFDKNLTMYESACEPIGQDGNCNLDQQSFKAYYSRFIAAAVKNAPWLDAITKPYLAASAIAAAASCIGGPTASDCGLKWTTNGTYDGLTGVGQQMSALEIFISNLVEHVKPPVNQHHGGMGTPDASLGTGTDKPTKPLSYISKKEKTGAICLTVAMIFGMLGGGWWMATGL